MPSPVARANREVRFALACAWAGVEVPGDVAASGYKTYCPFGELSHDDGGAEPAFRVYPDHGFCFACGESFSPVKLCALVWDCTPEEAAREMLERAGIADPDYRQQWQRLVNWSQPPDLDGLADALRVYCAAICPQWKTRQYDKPVADKREACLRLLALVRTEADCRTWLAGCKQAMTRVLSEGARQ